MANGVKPDQTVPLLLCLLVSKFGVNMVPYGTYFVSKELGTCPFTRYTRSPKKGFIIQVNPLLINN